MHCVLVYLLSFGMKTFRLYGMIIYETQIDKNNTITPLLFIGRELVQWLEARPLK